MKLHPLPSQTEKIPSPVHFTNPFEYEPHPLCIAAKEAVVEYLHSQTEWTEELSAGKMMGVLVVRNGSERGFLAAFSGTLAGKTQQAYFVPPVFDLMAPDCYFQEEEKKISEINKEIERLKCSIHSHLELKELAQKKIEEARMRMLEARKNRQTLRKTLSEEELESQAEEFVRQSQFLKAEVKRTERRWAARLQEAEAMNAPIRNQITQMEEERQHRSQSLQQWLFQQFSFFNAKGEQKDLLEMFRPFAPPSGAGECCGPRLLQYAYRNGYVPLCMAEFWVGASPQREIRHEGHFYTACRSRCLPILTHMLKGLDVEVSQREKETEKLVNEVKIVLQTKEYVILNKPSGMLSVPGKEHLPDILTFVRHLFPEADGPMIVHRLDMDTSGLMVVALTDNMYHQLQNLFLHRQVQKTYIALLEHPMTEGEEGDICLPLRPDFYDNPRQTVDMENGKTAITRYKVLGLVDGHARVALFPETGRTHQLRVHCAHKQGLNNPIVGDRLYGISSGRLMLHASRLSFLGKTVENYAF